MLRLISFSFLIFMLIFSLACKKDSKRRIDKFHRRDVGYSAHDILSDKNYKSMTVEIIYMTGFKPTDLAIDHLKQLISARCNKPDGVQWVFREIPTQGKSSYSIDDVVSIENDSREEFTFKKDLAICFLFLDGPSSENQGSSMVLGQAYFNTSMVIYEKSLQDNSDGFGQPELYKLETTVINHEFGHIMGLVNNGTEMYHPHQDGTNGSHCNNSACLMYWEAETGTVFSNLVGSSPIPTLDQNCLKDLKEKGGK